MKSKQKKYKSKLNILTQVSLLQSFNISFIFDKASIKLTFDLKKNECDRIASIKNFFYPLQFENSLTLCINYFFIKQANANLTNLDKNTNIKMELHSFNLNSSFILEFSHIEKNGILSYSKISKEEYIDLTKILYQNKLKQTSLLMECVGKYLESVVNFKSICFYHTNQGSALIRKYFEEQQKEFNKNEKSKIEYSLKKGVDINFAFTDNYISSDSKQYNLWYSLIKSNTEEKLEEYISLTNVFINYKSKSKEITLKPTYNETAVSKTLSEYSKNIENGSSVRDKEKIKEISKERSKSHITEKKANLKKSSSITPTITDRIDTKNIYQVKPKITSLKKENTQENKLNKSAHISDIGINSALNTDNFFEKNIKKTMKGKKCDTPKFKLTKEQNLNSDFYNENKIKQDKDEQSKKSSSVSNDTNDNNYIQLLMDLCEKSKSIHQLHEVIDMNHIVDNTSEMFARFIFTDIYKGIFKEIYSFEENNIGIMKPPSIYLFMKCILAMKCILLSSENISVLSGLLMEIG